ncbi:MAG TPA: AMP-binding protein [Candidatus Acidoferrales bacterium]|jgi:long-chain acyl-CoA synthetase|nr:AMP-binding protein [Candidatus Acidoferrales bacterium]
MPGNLSADELPLQRIYKWERERPDAVFLTQPLGGGKVRDWTWGQSAAEIRRMATWLKAQNWEPGSCVAILSRNCAWWIMADLAIWMAGHVTVPIYPSLKAQSIRQILEHCSAKACFLGATDEREATAGGIPAGVICVRFPTAAPAAAGDGPTGDWPAWEVLVTANRPISGNPTRPGDDLSTIIYTSGTTGAPKGVMHSFATFAFSAKSLAEFIGFTSRERILSYLPLAHIVERAGLEGTAIYLGYRVFFGEGLETFLADLTRARPTIFLSVPRLLLKFQQGVFAKIAERKLERLLRIPILNSFVKKRVLRQLGLDTVRNAACGAAPLPPELLLWYRKLGLNLGEGYGMTETLITHLSAPGSVRPGYVGCALPGVEAKINADGELLLRSPMNMLGYYKNPESTRASFTTDGFFRTGDLARIDPDGQLTIVGRLKEQFKTSKGKYVMPTPIESHLLAHPVVDACCLMGAGMAHPFAVVLLAGETLKAAALPAGRARVEQTLLDLMNLVNTQLDPHERLSFVAVAQGPWTVGNGFVTPTLKIKRNVLEARYQSCVDAWMRQNRPVVWESPPEDAIRAAS